jgi:capsular exopolysaccharide family
MNQRTDVAPFWSNPQESPENTLAQYIGIAWRHRRMIFVWAVGLALAAAVWSYLQKPIYQARATIVIEQEGPGALDKDRYQPQDVSPEYFQTHFELMRSHQVLQRTAEILNLSEQSEYRSKPSVLGKIFQAAALPGLIQSLWKTEKFSEDSPTDQNEDFLLKQFSQRIDIMPVRGARLAHITVNSEDPAFAALAGNTLASVYIERSQEISAKSKEKAARWFTDHLDELRKKVEVSQQALYVFRSQHELLEGHERQTVAAQKLAELNSELVKAEMKKAEARTRYQHIRSAIEKPSGEGTIDWSILDTSTEVLSSPLIQTLRMQEVRVSGQVAELSDKYGPLHPKMARVKAELQDLRERIQQEVRKIYDSIKHEYDVSVSREQAIRDALGRYKKDKIKLEQYEIEYGILERDAQSSQHLYDIFLRMTKEADLSSGMKADNVYLADPAMPSSIPVKPRKTLNVVLGFLVGLLTGVGGALVLDARDRSLKGPDDVERYLPSISLLGVVPRLPKPNHANGTLLLSADSLSLAAESFRVIRTSLLLSSPTDLPSHVLITSPGESEGKTTLAVNLAVAMAQLEDTHVMLIDADLRQSNPHPIFHVQNGGGPPQGLVHFLSGDADVQEIIYQTDIPNLSVIPRGCSPSNPSELLHSKHMSKLLKACREQGYHVILDAPPVLPVTDPVVLAPQVDGVLLVISAGETSREACRLAIHRLTISGGKFLGIVLQKAQIKDLPSYSSYCKSGEAGFAAESSQEWIGRTIVKR